MSKPEYEDSLAEQYRDILDDEDIIIKEITPTNSSANGSYTWEIDKESRNVVLNTALEKGQNRNHGSKFFF